MPSRRPAPDPDPTATEPTAEGADAEPLATADRPDADRPDGDRGDGDRRGDGEAGSVVRRGPYAANPQVGARGQRTQQRIMDAALQVFGEVGYHQCGIARIAEVAGCSRVAFYQYFSGKEDVFRQLAGQVSRQLAASLQDLDPLTADACGWAALRAWIGAYVDIHERYAPVFDAFPAAFETDEVVAKGSARVGARNVALVRARVVEPSLAPDQLDAVIELLLQCISHTQDTAIKLRAAAPDAYPRRRVEDALTDVAHRTLFGLRRDVNVHPPAPEPPPVLKFGSVMQEVVRDEGATSQLTANGRRTHEALLAAGRDVFLARGYHRTRVDDVVRAARVSHGAFYRYFEGKDHLAHVLAGRAMRAVSSSVAAIPRAVGDGSAGRETLRHWLRHYNTTQASEAAMIGVWVDAALQDPALGPESAAALDWGRRRMVAFLQGRGFGDVDTEAVVMMSLLSRFGTRERPAATLDAAVDVIERGLLGR